MGDRAADSLAEFRCECGSVEFVATHLGVACCECEAVYEDDGHWEVEDDAR